MSLASMFHRLGGRWGAEGLDLLVPPRCAGCQGDLPAANGEALGSAATGATGVLVCPSCCRDLSHDSARCGVCGERSGASPPCEGCRRLRHRCAGLAVLGSYQGQLRTAILRCKRPSGEPLAVALAGLLVGKHRQTFTDWNVDLVVPVPMHWSRRMVRGTSAADELAVEIARRLRLPCRPALRRSVATRMQNEFPLEARRGNVANAFRVRSDVRAKTILVVDDVCTTGSTLAACCTALMVAGATTVYAAVVAKADRSPNAGDD